jgi:16S rRNA (guanine966-N2)-methyltransferase
MRVVAGRLRGRTLVAPPGRLTRPTSDRVREALFAILGSVEGAGVLDLFAGSGALAIESLSRGAAAATLVDRSGSSVAAIRRNLDALDLDAEVHREDVRAFLRRTRRDGRQYDLVFVDPPYRRAAGLAKTLSTAITPVLSEDARVVAESDHREPLELGLAMIDQRRYGDTLINFYGAR